MRKKFWTTEDWEKRTKGKPKRMSPALSLFGIGLVCWGLGAGPAQAQGERLIDPG